MPVKAEQTAKQTELTDMDKVNQALRMYYKATNQPNIQFRIHHTIVLTQFEKIIGNICLPPQSFITPLGVRSIVQPYLLPVASLLMEYSWLLVPIGLLLIKYVCQGSIASIILLTLSLAGLFMYAEFVKEREPQISEQIWAQSSGQIARKEAFSQTLDNFQAALAYQRKQAEVEQQKLKMDQSLDMQIGAIEDLVYGDREKYCKESYVIRVTRLGRDLGLQIPDKDLLSSRENLVKFVQKLSGNVFGNKDDVQEVH
eukprot:TRINITY_DN17170_c0_g1_i2.p1 TRINITY_DN17170_c0_g1~~TRINITY_DN17170_c0_g1_i2.p1  ORF type:complete len:271 (+),score=-1.25 TRINITY_DN17170_c0_g1_i2:46-813(+)